MKKCSLNCPVCAQAFNYRVKRHWFLKHVLFFVPVKVYFCGNCKKLVYVMLTDKEMAGV